MNKGKKLIKIIYSSTDLHNPKIFISDSRKNGLNLLEIVIGNK